MRISLLLTIGATLLTLSLQGQAVSNQPNLEDVGQPSIDVMLGADPQPLRTFVSEKGTASLWLRAVDAQGQPFSTGATNFDVGGTLFQSESLVLWFRGCRESAFSGKAVDCDEFNVKVEKTGPNLARVTMPARAIVIHVTHDNLSRDVHVEVNRRVWVPVLSGGLMMSTGRPTRYRLITDSNAQTVVQDGKDDQTRAFVAMEHLMVRNFPVALAFGVGAESAKLESMSVLLGLSYIIRPRAMIDTVVFSAGAAYLPYQAVKPQYVDARSVPAGVGIADVLETHRRFTPFIALTFRTGGRDISGDLGGKP